MFLLHWVLLIAPICYLFRSSLRSPRSRIVENLLNLLEREGKQHYGENVTQLEHALQCAKMAARITKYHPRFRGARRRFFIAAALLHDIGHLLPKVKGKGSLGVINHAEEGGLFLRQQGFPAYICDIIHDHALSKRYLCTTSKEYFNLLSRASQETFVAQGGYLSSAQVACFKGDPLFRDKILLRLCDDFSKREDIHISNRLWKGIYGSLLDDLLNSCDPT
jgi:putative nucleotidyltransferase with HDIG domain